ncbi:glycosyltransferase family 2 protein [Nonomuraea purpurea]|uniref:Glycosyltransferase family 2 protein n=1 Tax=Nonomuraea purpurea TaxID=1849276 RepID=A0ABV8GRM3_9ACTN
MRDPQLTVVIPVKLGGALGREMRGALLRLCLVALDCQTAPRSAFEVVVVDDGSDLDLDALVGEFARRHLSIRPRTIRNTGPSHGQTAAYNAGIDAARGRHVLLTTDDSMLAPDCVAAHLTAQAGRMAGAYVCGVERQYVYGVLFRNISSGSLHPRGDLAVRLFGTLLGFADIREAAEQLGFTDWTITPADVRTRFAELYRLSALTPSFADMYEELRSDRTDLRWLSVRMGNHSIARDALLRIGGLDETVPGGNSDQDLGLKLIDAGVRIELDPRATSILIEHRRDPRAFADGSGLARLAERWPRPDVLNLHAFFSRGYGRTIASYRQILERA